MSGRVVHTFFFVWQGISDFFVFFCAFFPPGNPGGMHESASRDANRGGTGTSDMSDMSGGHPGSDSATDLKKVRIDDTICTQPILVGCQ